MTSYDEMLRIILPVLAAAFFACLGIAAARLLSARRNIIKARMEEKDSKKAAYMRSEDNAGPLVRLERKLSMADVGINVPTYLAIMAVSAVVIYLLVVYLTDAVIMGVLCACAGAAVPPYVTDFLKRRRQNEFDSMFIKALKRMAADMRADVSLEQAIADVAGAGSMPGIIRREFSQCLADYRFGGSMTGAFLKMYARTGDPDVRGVAISVEISDRYGSDLADVFESYAGTISRRKVMEAEARAELASTRSDTVIVCLVPFLFGAGMKIMQPDYFDAAYAWLGGLGRYLLVLTYGVVVFGFLFLMKKCDVRITE